MRSCGRSMPIETDRHTIPAWWPGERPGHRPAKKKKKKAFLFWAGMLYSEARQGPQRNGPALLDNANLHISVQSLGVNVQEHCSKDAKLGKLILLP